MLVTINKTNDMKEVSRRPRKQAVTALDFVGSLKPGSLAVRKDSERFRQMTDLSALLKAKS